MTRRRSVMNLALLVALATGTGLAHAAGSPANAASGAAGAAPATQTPAAVIAAAAGEVSIERSTAAAPLKGTIGARLLPGDVVKVGKGGSATVYLAGGGIVRVPAGNRIEIPKEAAAGKGAPRSMASAPAGAISSRSVEVLEAGLWILNDPEGSVLLTAMRGEDDWDAAEVDGAARPLSPRYETVLDDRPRFVWSGDAEARVVISQGSSVVWKSGAVRSPFAPGADGPALKPGTLYRWWVEPVAGAPAPPVSAPFRTAERREQGDADRFETEIGALASGPDGPALAGLMRCAYYLKSGAWTRVVTAAGTLRAETASADAAARALEGSRLQMRLDEESFDALVAAVAK